MTAKKTKLLKKLVRRLGELGTPDEFFRPSVIDAIVQGKVMIINATLTRPCVCDMCGGMHHFKMAAIKNATVLPLEQLFCE